MIILPDSEDRTIVSLLVWTKHPNVTVGQRDGQTDSLWLLQRSALRAMRTRWKKILILMIYTNLHLILHCFQVMADYWSNFR